MTAPWHVTEALATRYARGAAPEPDAWSLERHVETCTACASRVSAAVAATPAGPALAHVRSALLAAVRPEEVSPEAVRHQAVSPQPVRPHVVSPQAPVPVPVPVGAVPAGAVAARRRRPTGTPGPRLARMVWAAGPALRGAWLVAVLVVVAAAVGLAHGAGFQGVRPVLLAVAPVLPLGGVAVSYGRHADPMYEIGVATPSGGLRLLLTRAAAVLGVCVPLLTAAGALLPPVTGVPGAAAWLLPGLALTLATLVLGSFVGCRAAAATLTGGWLLAVAGPVLGRPGATGELARYLSGPAAQGGWAAAVVLCGCLLALRRRSFDRLETS
ncbi:zf-HC2 domain-containing protein [Streptomyces sp. QHH-9511]|uniref:zf-HC2 domain-containing protein n=1 Tax=Streptomyces sp. QHH-9511 TaxID=2684468 RepID=UPI0013161799|nr:zf-HC2 domain-containing protein [Streptomyces sp. QHH-9511]QGZ50945.1 zf-HC2 domain-containing protein [Streptomyces sp. QHH-9511]